MYACKGGHKDVVQLLLDHSNANVELNVKDSVGNTALMHACKNGHKDVVKLLLDHSDFKQIEKVTLICTFSRKPIRDRT